MKRQLEITLVLVLQVLAALAQKPDTAQLLVHYKLQEADAGGDQQFC